MRGQPGFWDLDERYERLSAVGDPLEKLNAIIPWAVFEKPLAKALKRSDGSKGGRPPFPVVVMFKILVLQALYNLSDDQAEFVIQDRLSFMRFLGLSLSEKAPDSKAKQPTETPTSAATKQHDIAIPMFGYKNHAGIDRAHGFIRGWTVTSASAHDGAQLRNVVTKDNTASTVWADTAYRSKTKRNG